jgi:ATP-dependent exoDNAse (exonuclease V) alpha subunit
VVTNAHRINAGQMPVMQGLDDFYLFAEDDPERMADLVVDIVTNRVPRRFGLDPRRDVQVLCPMHRGPAGAGVLNEKLQEALTPARPGLPERRYGGRVYRVGDGPVEEQVHVGLAPLAPLAQVRGQRARAVHMRGATGGPWLHPLQAGVHRRDAQGRAGGHARCQQALGSWSPSRSNT